MEEIKKNISDGPKISWTAPEFTEYDKKPSWYASIAIVGVILIIFFIFTKIYAGAAVMIAAMLVLFSQATIKPKNTQYSISSEGISINDKLIPMDKLKSFWIVQTDTLPRLYIVRVGKISLPISVYLKDVNEANIKNILTKYLPEENDGGELIHETINKWFKF